MSYDDTNRGVLFKNNKKNTDRHPDYNGSINVAGVDYFISGWIKEAGPNSQNPGSKFLSVSVTPKNPSDNFETVKPRSPKPKPSFDDLGDDVPFN